MIEKSELDYRKLIENEMDSLDLDAKTRTKLLAESNDIILLALESKDEHEFLIRLAEKEQKPFYMADFKYRHVIDFLIKRRHISKKSVLEDFRNRISKATEDSGKVASIESINAMHGQMMAISEESLNGATDYNVSTDVVSSPNQAKSWVKEKVKLGLGICFMYKSGKWVLLGVDSDLEFEKGRIESLFSQDVLNSLWKSHRPSAHNDRREFNAARRVGGLN